MTDLKVITMKKLNIPYDRQFYHMPVKHYMDLCEKLGPDEVLRYVRNILMDNKHNKVVAEKARLLIRTLDPIDLLEDILDNDLKCECGFDTMGESYESCPCCGKSFWEGKECYYKVDGHLCSLDGEECEWFNTQECGKLEDD
jgi:hypothetical protein